MDRLNCILIVLCVIVIKTSSISADVSLESVTFEPSETLTTTITAQDNASEFYDNNNNDDNENENAKVEQRSIAEHNGMELPLNNPDRHAAFRKRAKPLKSIFMGIYKNYKSTYLGNKTFAEYKRTLHTHAQNEQNEQDPAHVETTNIEEKSDAFDDNIERNNENDSTEVNNIGTQESLVRDDNESASQQLPAIEAKTQNSKKKKKKQRNRKRNHRRKKHGKRQLQAEIKANTPKSPIYSYDFGPAVNMSLDVNNEIVKLHLDGENLHNIMQGRWLKDNGEARGKKYEMITRVLPLFIIPFLIQSAIVPFLVMKLKLLLMKSILVGKLAIFLLVISAIRNSNKMMQTYEVAPSYWAGEPSRRSELAAVASAGAYNGYRVEGKPTAWIN